MKSKKGLRFALILAACAVMLLQGCSQEEKEMEGKVKIISYNVLVEWCTEYNGANTGVTKTYELASRLADLSELLKKEKPDSFGVQECSCDQTASFEKSAGLWLRRSHGHRRRG